MNCPGSVAAIEAIPKHLRRKTSKYANEGTAAHKLLEMCLRKDQDADEYADRVIRVLTDEHGASTAHLAMKGSKHYGDCEESSFKVNKNMIEAVQTCIDHVRDEVDRLRKKYGDPVEVVLEAKCVPYDDTDEASGTGDVIITAWPHEIVVIDYKHGSGVLVQIGGNTQMRCYMMGHARLDHFNFKKGKVTIAQPRYNHEDGPVRSEYVSMKELQEFRDEVREAVRRTERPNAKFAAGDWCKWCDAAETCKTLKKWQGQQAARDFEEVGEDE